jgi:hypothetical protein
VTGVNGEITPDRWRLRPVAAAAALAGGAVLVLVAVFGGLFGSDGGGSPVGSPSFRTTTRPPVSTATTSSLATSSPAATATSSTLRPPVLPAAAAQPTRPGAEAFLRYFFAVYNYSFSSLDTSALQAVSDAKCAFCRSAATNVRGIADLPGRSEAGEIGIDAVVAAPGDERKGLVVNAVLTQAPGQVVDATGSIVSTVSPTTGRRMDALVRWNGSAWRMVGVDPNPGG